MEEKIVYPRFIETSPCGEDLFQSGAQRRTATTISEHIKKGTSHYRLIGMDGSWGAGKSNVISIIEKQLQDSHHVFIYDAWSHQEDLQRRSFLEGLTDNLQQHHIVDQVEWRDKLKKLLAKKKETVQQTIPKLSYAIIIAFLATVLTPITTSIANIVKNDFWKIFLSCSPILIALAIWAIASWKNKKYRNFLDLFYLYKEKDLETITNEVITESEPSVREFRNWMFDLEESLQKKDLIIVFDNMDRLPPDKVQTLWSSIHTFFSESNILKRIWVIVPFDRIHIKEAFSSDEEKSNHFINKTFSVIYRVPPAVLTDWWDFFEIKFIDAFGESERGELSMVKGIFDRYQYIITPRKVISFLNELVTLKLTWNDEIKLRYMALFLVNKESILNDPVSSIIGKEYRVKVAELFPDDEQIDDNIAALVYNVSKETAAQVTLQREIVLAIRERDVENLEKLSQHKDFFKILEEIYVREDMDFVNSVHALGSISLENGNGYAKNALRDIWTKLAIKQRGVAIDDQSFAGTQRILLANCPEHSRVTLIRYIVGQYSVSRNFKGNDYYSAMNDLDEFIRENKWDIKLPDLMRRTQMQPQQFIDFVLKAEKDYDYFNCYCDNGQLENFFVDRFQNDREGMSILKYIKDEYKFPTLTEKLEETIAGEGVTIDNVSDLIEIYRNLSKDRLLATKIPDSKIDLLLSQSQDNSNEYFELTAMRLARGETWKGSLARANSMLTTIDEKQIDAIASKIESFETFGTLLKLAVTWKQPILNEVIKSLILKSRGTSNASILEVVPLFDQIIEATGVSDIELLKRFNGWSRHFKGQLNEENLQNSVPSFNVFQSCLQITNDFSAHLFETATSYIEKIDENRWAEVFKGETDYEFMLLGFLLKSQVLKAIPNKALEAYKNALILISEEAEELRHQKEVWDTLYLSADKRHLKGTIKNIRDSFIQKGNIGPNLFLLLEEALRITGNLEERAGDVFRRIITPIIGNEASLDMIVQHSSFYLSLFSRASEEQIDFIKAFRKVQEQRPGIEFINKFSNGLDGIVAEKISIKESRYYTDENSADVTEKIKQIVEREKVLHFKIDNGIVDGNDPHSGVQKRLSLKFDFEGKEYNHSYNEGDWLNIP